MKNTFVLSLAAMAALLILTIFSLVKIPQTEPPVPAEVETYTAGDFDQIRIRKTYRLSPSDDPSTIPTEDFEQSGRTYHLLELTKEENAGEPLYIAVFGDAATPYSDTNGMTIT